MPIEHESYESVLAWARERMQALDLQTLHSAGIYRTPNEQYLTGTYPPLKALAPMEADEIFAGASGVYNAYLHIPFCEQYCTFCHFFKEINAQDSRVERYVRTLLSEIDLVTDRAGEQPTAETVYFGGGTPSYLSASQLQRVFDKLWSRLHRTSDTEVTFELHPGVVRQPDYEERLDTIAANGVNRFVFGIQSMDDQVLTKLNRGHGREEVFRLLDLLEARNVDNLSVDLIFGLPYQTTENWYRTLTELLDRGVEKYNIFPLFFKRSDPITKQYMREPEIFPDEQTRLVMHFMTERILTPKGFHRGPLFYYSKAEHHSRQQESKFEDIERVNLLPFGVSGFGYLGGTQFYNYCNMERHEAAVASGLPPVWRGWTLSPEERVRRSIMFSLRAHGFDVEQLTRTYDVDVEGRFGAEFTYLEDWGLIHREGSAISLTDLGAVLADAIALRFVSDDVIARAEETNRGIEKPSRDPLDRYDYSPLLRIDEPGGILTGSAGRSGE
jgi:oxygen-independent coproporphyrinogen-3 oxidase